MSGRVDVLLVAGVALLCALPGIATAGTKATIVLTATVAPRLCSADNTDPNCIQTVQTVQTVQKLVSPSQNMLPAAGTTTQSGDTAIGSTFSIVTVSAK